MKIKEIEIKNFGKFSNQRFVFRDGIQVFYGENEFGKSTIYGFLKAMLFGMERGRGKAAHNDAFSRFEPWENPNEYAGAMRFSCGEKTFCLKRRFDRYTKGAVLICEDDGEELSVEHGDLDMLLNGLTAEQFENTAAIGQLGARPGQSLAAELQNYAANYYETGNSGVDLAGAEERLKQRKKEITRKWKQLESEKAEKRQALQRKYQYIQQEKMRLESEMQEKKRQLADLREPEHVTEEEKKKIQLADNRSHMSVGSWHASAQCIYIDSSHGKYFVSYLGNERRADTKKCPDQRTRNDGIRLQGAKSRSCTGRCSASGRNRRKSTSV